MLNEKMSPQEFKEFMEYQLHEIEKYKWYLGVELCHDPLEDKTMNEISSEWIKKFSVICRKEWGEIKNK